MADLENDDVRAALDAAKRHGFRFVRLRNGEEEFSAEIGPGAPKRRATSEDQGHSKPTESAEPGPIEVSSPVVGYYRERSDPIEPGVEVEAGQVIAEVVAVGLANDVLAPVTGVVESVEVRPGDALEYGQLIATVRPR